MIRHRISIPLQHQQNIADGPGLFYFLSQQSLSPLFPAQLVESTCSPVRQWCARVNTTALRRSCARATRPPYRGKPPYSFQVMRAIPQSRRAILTALYRDTALLGDPYCNESEDSFHVVSAISQSRQAISTASCRDTVLLT